MFSEAGIEQRQPESGSLGRVAPLSSPFDMAASMPGFVPSGEQPNTLVARTRPCTRAKMGSGATVSYAELNGSGIPASDDSGNTSGGDTVHMPQNSPVVKQEDGGVFEKKKVGRPISYNGDVNSKDLTDAERRRIKRRVANRESARRVRQKRQETMEEMQHRMEAMMQQIAALTAHLQGVETQKSQLQQQLDMMRSRWSQAVNDNVQLQGDAYSPTDISGEPSSSSPSSNPNMDLHAPSMASVHASASPTAALPATLASWAPAACGGAVTSGQPPLHGLPASASATAVKCFRSGVTITSAIGGSGCGSGGSQQQQTQTPPMLHVTAPPTVSLAPASCAFMQQQTTQDEPLQDVSSVHNDMLQWFLDQSSVQPLPSLNQDAALA